MSEPSPVVYLLHGDDEYTIAQEVAKLEANLGDDALREANTTSLDGRSFNLDDLVSVVSPMPFIAKRRVVILTHPLARLESKEAKAKFLNKQKLTKDREKIIENFEKVPLTTALVLVEHKLLTSDWERKKGNLHWLERWAGSDRERAYVKAFPLGNMEGWIQNRAAQEGGQFTYEAARRLAELVGADTRLADQEIRKLLDYADYKRPVEKEDVDLLTPDSSQADVFAMVDALGMRDGQKASLILQRLLEQQEHGFIFAMVVRQFRLLLLVREILDGGGGGDEIAAKLGFLGLKKWMSRKLIPQAKRFSLPVLEEIYHRLLNLDDDVKSGLIPVDLALQIFVSELTSQSHYHSTSH
ncbi:MAG TPA: DNA polymerase III subunit delta [Anaerolineales bacterium]|nr:DNA polymerase III subunit delta [Anaerolineales bacterium]